jgi:hypothetical protein
MKNCKFTGKACDNPVFFMEKRSQSTHKTWVSPGWPDKKGRERKLNKPLGMLQGVESIWVNLTHRF